MVSVLSRDELTKAHIAAIDAQMKELAEMLPYSNDNTRTSFLRKINHLLDQRLEVMKEGGKC